METLASLVREQAATRGGRPAVTFEGRTQTYGDLDRRASSVARALLAEGVQPRDRIAVLDKNTSEFFEVFFGAAKVGAVCVAVNWRLAPNEVAFIVNDACAPVLFVGTEFLSTVEKIAGELETVRTIVVLGDDGPAAYDRYEQWLAPHPPEDPGHESTAEDVAIQFYTSGTTGLPKGVMLANRSLFALLPHVRAAWEVGDDAVFQVVMPLFHVAGTGWALCGLASGAHVVLLRDVDPAQILHQLEEYRVTHTLYVPVVLQFLLATPGIEHVDFGSLQLIVYGASPISEAVLRKSMERFGCKFSQAYGLSETNGAIVVLPPEDHAVGDPRAHRLHAAGRPLPGVELRIVDEHGRDAPTGTVGEIWTRSSQNMVGYWNRPEETAAALLADGWLRTGDAGYLDEDGYLYIHDRVKDMIVTGGENVYPAEVESVLMSHPAIADVAVIGVPHERWGETVKAIVVRAPATEVDEQSLIAYARERLAHYKCPTSVDWADALPRNPSGKILKKELREPYWRGRDRRVN